MKGFTLTTADTGWPWPSSLLWWKLQIQANILIPAHFSAKCHLWQNRLHQHLSFTQCFANGDYLGFILTHQAQKHLCQTPLSSTKALFAPELHFYYSFRVSLYYSLPWQTFGFANPEDEGLVVGPCGGNRKTKRSAWIKSWRARRHLKSGSWGVKKSGSTQPIQRLWFQSHLYSIRKRLVIAFRIILVPVVAVILLLSRWSVRPPSMTWPAHLNSVWLHEDSMFSFNFGST